MPTRPLTGEDLLASVELDTDKDTFFIQVKHIQLTSLCIFLHPFRWRCLILVKCFPADQQLEEEHHWRRASREHSWELHQ